ncbi:hypothetical protein SI65_04247 [Aspergillus cristatus]|uniref:Uncharacterized protein n=1 Tax=Aspergillus cristatus TaxID=573508 RepID=A0A1E3BJR6_ASPCR|nr:hypothetical protein SI65_04247 [Aspergillus cristatus]
MKPYGSKERVRNPFIDEHVWPWLVRKQIEAEAKKEAENYHNWYHYDSESELEPDSESELDTELDTVSDPKSDPKSDSDNGDDDDPFAQPEASWKRMLFQQPPTSHVGFIYYEFCWYEPSLYTRMRFLKPDYDPLRLKDIAPALEDGSMVADEGPCILWFKPRYSFDMIQNVIWYEEEYTGHICIHEFLWDCDFIIFENRNELHSNDDNGGKVDDDGDDEDASEREMVRWMDSVGEREIDQNNYRQDVRGYLPWSFEID